MFGETLTSFAQAKGGVHVRTYHPYSMDQERLGRLCSNLKRRYKMRIYKMWSTCTAQEWDVFMCTPVLYFSMTANEPITFKYYSFFYSSYVPP